MAGDRELNRIMKDLQKTVADLNRSYRKQNLPVTDGSRELHSLCAQLEFLLQFDLKEKRSFFGLRKDYWDFLCQGLAQCRQEHEGIRFVTSLDKLKTPVGRGRAFLRYCLVHQQLAETLQLCFLDHESLREWYYARSPFLNPQHRAEILGSLYELDGVTFQLALNRADLDTAWPTFSETLVWNSPEAKINRARMILQTNTHIKGRGWPDGISHPTAVPCEMPAHLSPPVLAALLTEGVEMDCVKRDLKAVEVKKKVEKEDEERMEKNGDEKDKEEVEYVELDEDVKKDMEEEAEENLEEDKKEMGDVDAEKPEDTLSAGKAAQPDGDGQPGTSPLPSTECMLAPPPLVPGQPGRMEASLRALVSQLQTELGQQEMALKALSAHLVQEKQRHRLWEEDRAQWAQLQAQETEALRETNIFLGQALAAAVAERDPGVLERAQEEAQSWQEVAEEQSAQLTGVLAEATSLASHHGDSLAAPAVMERMDVLEEPADPDDVATVKGVLCRALEIARHPQDSPPDAQAEEEPSTATGMAMCLATLAATAWEKAWQSQQQLLAQQQEVARLQEQLSRAQQDGERWALALQRAQQEALEREATRGAEQARQQELIRDMKGRLLELLREKDALWQKMEGIDTPMPGPAPRNTGLCAHCHKDFHLLSRRYSCRLCQDKVCHTCSVDVGKHRRYCLLCYQQRHPQAT